VLATVKELLKLDNICESYVHINKVSVFKSQFRVFFGYTMVKTFSYLDVIRARTDGQTNGTAHD